MMNFKSFLKPKMQTMELRQLTDGKYVGGIWQPGTETWVPFRAAIHPLSDDVLVYGEAGTYTQDDHRLWAYLKLEKGNKVRTGGESGEVYTVQSEKDFDFYSRGLRVYVVRREGAASA